MIVVPVKYDAELEWAYTDEEGHNRYIVYVQNKSNGDSFYIMVRDTGLVYVMGMGGEE